MKECICKGNLTNLKDCPVHKIVIPPQKRYFPCPICKGRGDLNDGEYVDWQQVSADTPCYYCEEKGMIEIDGEIHMRRKMEKIGLGLTKPGKEYSWDEIRELGRKEMVRKM